MKFELVNRIVALLFLVSAAIQYNDPDPWLWVAIYGSAAAACLVWERNRRTWPFAALVGLVALVWGGMLTPVLADFRFGDLFRSMKAKTPAIELSRELLGLLIIAGWMGVLVFLSRRSARRRD